jgi:protein ImuB
MLLLFHWTLMSFASIFVPHFMLQAVVRAEPALRERALALVEGTPPLCSVVAINEKAAQMGMKVGMAKTDATQFAGLEIRSRSQSQEKTAHAALLDIGWSVSPRMEDVAQDAIILDLSGLTSLFGSEKDIGAHLAHRASECGLLANVAIISNVETAQIAARGFPGITVIPLGQESEYLGRLPASVLSPSMEIAETLSRWGIHTCAAFAELPVLQLSERLGQEGVRLHALARGESVRSLVIAEPGYSFKEEMELDDAVEELDPLSFLLGRLLDQLCARLAARSLATAAIRVRFELQPSFENAVDRRKELFRLENSSGLYETDLQLPVPTCDSKILLKLLRLRLQSKPPGAPIQKIVMGADAARPRATQGGLFLPSFPDPEKLEVTIARIAHVVGEGNVGSPLLVDTYRPGEFQMQRFLIPMGVAETDRNHDNILHPKTQDKSSKAPTSFRSFRPPVPAKLELHAGRPTHIIFQGLRGEVFAASGPWRTSGDWWREDPWQQDEWDLEIDFQTPLERRDTSAKARTLYRVYYDSLRQSWLVRGIYD